MQVELDHLFIHGLMELDSTFIEACADVKADQDKRNDDD